MAHVEEWRPVPGFETYYEVSDMGRVRRIQPTGYRLRKVIRYASNYWRVSLRRPGTGPRLFAIHRLVLLAFVGPCPVGCEVNHLNGDRSDNRLSNLEYCTKRENALHSFRILGRAPQRGSAHGRSKLTEGEVIEIRRLHATGLSLSALHRLFPHSNVMNMSFIVRRKTWRHI